MLVEKILPVVRKRLLYIEPTARLIEAARLLGDGADMVLICDGSLHLVGVITKTDVVRMTGRCAGASCTAPIADVMTRDVLTTTPNAWLHDVWEMMRDHGLKNIPVLEGGDGVALGILNARDALQTLMQEIRYEERLLREYAMSLGYR